MNVEKIKSILNEKGIVSFTLYSLKYTIQKTNDGVVIFSESYTSRNNKFDDIDKLLKKYLIYGENILSNESRIIDIR